MFRAFTRVKVRVGERVGSERANARFLGTLRLYEGEFRRHNIRVRARGVLQQQLRALFPNAHQCGRCGHGPVMHRACSSLTTHDGEWVGRTGRISNACASCGWFAADISAWPAWDGRVPEQADATTGGDGGGDGGDDGGGAGLGAAPTRARLEPTNAAEAAEHLREALALSQMADTRRHAEAAVAVRAAPRRTQWGWRAFFWWAGAATTVAAAIVYGVAYDGIWDTLTNVVCAAFMLFVTGAYAPYYAAAVRGVRAVWCDDRLWRRVRTCTGHDVARMIFDGAIASYVVYLASLLLHPIIFRFGMVWLIVMLVARTTARMLSRSGPASDW